MVSEFIVRMFTGILYIDIVLTVVAFCFAAILFSRGLHPVYTNFAFCILSLALWMLTDLLVLFNIFSEYGPILNNISFLFGVLLTHFFVVFAFKYPVPDAKDKTKIISLYILTLLFALSIFIPGLYTEKVVSEFPFTYASINFVGISLFFFYFSFCALVFLYVLARKAKTFGGFHAVIIKKVLVGTALAYVGNVIFSVGFYFFTPLDMDPLGMLFTFGIMAYLLSILSPVTLRLVPKNS